MWGQDNFQLQQPIVGIGLGILLGYAVALWGLLYKESWRTRLGLVALVGIALISRLLWYDQYPPGLHEDEVKLATCSYQQWKGGIWRPEGCTGLPALLWVTFRAPLLDWFGPQTWAIRGYSVATGIAAIPVGFALGRRLGLGAGGAFAFASLAGFLPWSLFYGRVAFGGELIFHEMLLLAGLATLVFRSGSLGFALFLATLGQSLLFYDYFAGRFFAPFALVCAALATGRARVLCLLVPVLSVLAWTPYLTARPNFVFGPHQLAPSPENLLTELPERLWSVLRVFLLPQCNEAMAISLRAAAVHPALVLVLALIGVAMSFRLRPRLALFILGGFAVGIFPAVVTAHYGVSSHRILMAYPFVALAAVAAMQPLTVPVARGLALVTLVSIAGAESARFFFSPRFWYETSRLHYGWEPTGALKAIPDPVPGKAFLARDLGYWGTLRETFDPNVHWLSMADWFPQQSGSTFYAFSAHAETAKEFYREWVGRERVHEAGRAFTVRMEPEDTLALQGRGWSYMTSCGQGMLSLEVPHVFQPRASPAFPHCQGEHVQVWRGRWIGPRVSLRADTVDVFAWVRVGEQVFTLETNTHLSIPFTVEPGDLLEVGMRHPPKATWLMLQQVSGGSVRLPPFAFVEPIPRCEDVPSVLPVRSGR